MPLLRANEGNSLTLKSHSLVRMSWNNALSSPATALNGGTISSNGISSKRITLFTIQFLFISTQNIQAIHKAFQGCNNFIQRPDCARAIPVCNRQAQSAVELSRAREIHMFT